MKFTKLDASPKTNTYIISKFVAKSLAFPASVPTLQIYYSRPEDDVTPTYWKFWLNHRWRYANLLEILAEASCHIFPWRYVTRSSSSSFHLLGLIGMRLARQLYYYIWFNAHASQAFLALPLRLPCMEITQRARKRKSSSSRSLCNQETRFLLVFVVHTCHMPFLRIRPGISRDEQTLATITFDKIDKRNVVFWSSPGVTGGSRLPGWVDWAIRHIRVVKRWVVSGLARGKRVHCKSLFKENELSVCPVKVNRYLSFLFTASLSLPLRCILPI